jgi:hypothetical protein
MCRWPCSFVPATTQVDLFLDAEFAFTFEPLPIERVASKPFLLNAEYEHGHLPVY